MGHTGVNTSDFEGYLGILFGNELIIRDILFSIVFILLACFSLVFRVNFPLFGRTIKTITSVKERQNLFDPSIKENYLFKGFQKLQTLLLSTILLYLLYLEYFDVQDQTLTEAFSQFFIIGLMCYGMHLLRQGAGLTYGQVLGGREKFKFWHSNYHSFSYIWGASLYFPVVWLMFDHEALIAASAILICTYTLYRFSIIYITIRIFYNDGTSLLYLISYLCAQEIAPLLFLYEGLYYLHNRIEINLLWH